MRASRAIAILVVLLPGCVGLQKVLDRDTPRNATSGYVAAIFTNTSTTLGRGHAFGLGIVDAKTGADFVMPFGDQTSEPNAAIVELPPGEYRVAYWVTYARLTRSREGKKDLPDGHALGRRFKVAAGEVVLLGALAANTSTSGSTSANVAFTWNWTIQALPVRDSVARQKLASDYPNFVGAPVRCIVCTPDESAPQAGPNGGPALGLPKLQL
jgi:hypothetical protein